MGKNRIYTLIYFLIFVIPLILSAFIRTGFSYLWDNVDSYLLYFLSGIIAVLSRKIKIKNLALLFQIGVSVNLLLKVLGLPLLYHDIEVYRFISIFIFLLLSYVWYFFFHRIIKIWHVLLTLCFAILIPVFDLLDRIYIRDFSLFINTYAGSVVDTVVIVLGLLLGALLSLIKSKRKILIVLIISLPLSWGIAMYGDRIITNLLLYSSFTGETEIPVSFLMQDKNGAILTQKDINKEYEVVYVWEYGVRRYYDLQKLEYYYWKYKDNERVCFYVISVCEDKKTDKQNPFEEYESYHITAPLYVAINPSDLRDQIGDCRGKEMVCIMRNDTVIYRNEMSKAGEYLDDLMRKKR